MREYPQFIGYKARDEDRRAARQIARALNVQSVSEAIRWAVLRTAAELSSRHEEAQHEVTQ